MLFALLGSNPYETYFIPAANGISLAVLSAPIQPSTPEYVNHGPATWITPVPRPI